MKNLLERFGNWYFDTLDRIENKALQSLVVTITILLIVIVSITILMSIILTLIYILGDIGIGICLLIALFCLIWFAIHTIINA